MKRLPLILAIGSAALIASRLSKDGAVDFGAMRKKWMDRMMDAMPEDSPPRLIRSMLPRLVEQNDQILAALKEQNQLLRRMSAKK